MENTGGLCGVFDKTEAQRWNESHVHNCYVTMWSICCQGDNSLVPVSRIVIGGWSNITKQKTKTKKNLFTLVHTKMHKYQLMVIYLYK